MQQREEMKEEITLGSDREAAVIAMTLQLLKK